MGFPGGANGKQRVCQFMRYLRQGFNPWVGKIPWRGIGNQLQYSSLGNPMDRGAWWATIDGSCKELDMT